MMRVALALLAACAAPSARSTPPAPLSRLQSRVDVMVHLRPQNGAPVRMFTRFEIVFDRALGMHARSDIDHVELVCDGTRAWTIYPQCRIESSCDDTVRRWFDIGWGYAELARFVAGETPPAPNWKITHRRGLRKYTFPTSSLIVTADGSGFPWVDIGWRTWIPDRVDLAPVIARARALPACP